MPLPPGVSEREFASALEEFRRVVGDAWVFSSDADLDLYRDAYSPLRGEDEDPVPSAAVAPNATEQVQTHVQFMDDVMESYSFNDHALRRFHEQMKDAIDPNGILAPGKNGN